ncbi:MAG: HNH endonuclease, partial [Nitrososphaera sp.]|nr:HNH endonuclease [Nitrososphaera sp.]
MIVYIWNLTPGGPRNVRPSGEFRIQITGIRPPPRIERGTQTLLLGWHDEYEVFAGYDTRRHTSFSTRSPSIQVHESALVHAAQYGFGFYQRNNEEIVVTFTLDEFMNYVLNQGAFHRFGASQDQVEILVTATQEEPEVHEVGEIPEEREELLRSVRTWVRQRDFRQRVLSAYHHQCAVCQTQLGLVQAAHIVPVHFPGSNDLTRNGIALCPTHHLAYDGALLGIASNYHVIANESRLHQLRIQGLSQGEDDIL